MPTINFEGYIEDGTVAYAAYITVQGDTSEEIWAKAQAEGQRRGFDPKTLQAVGLHNRRSDWEAIYGPAKPDDAFSDYDPWAARVIADLEEQEELRWARPSFWQRIKELFA